jgi:hypothetical protein
LFPSSTSGNNNKKDVTTIPNAKIVSLQKNQFNMTTRYRIAFYIVGLIIGSYFVGKFLTAKAESRGVAFCYFPNCRVIKDLRSKPFKTSPEVAAIFQKNITNQQQIDEALANGEVNFEKSNIKIPGGKKYEIDTQLPNNKKVTLIINNYTDHIVLQEIKFI